MQVPCGYILVEVDRLEEARSTMTAPWEESARLGISAEFPVVGADLVRLAMAEGDISLAQQVAAAVGDVVGATTWPGCAARPPPSSGGQPAV